MGQIVSNIGSYMTYLAITIWAWQITGSATALALVGFFTILSRILVSPFAGVIVDRFNRKYLMMLGDSVAAILTIVLLLLYLTENLQIWHLYLTGLINGGFVQIQELAYSSSIAMMVPKHQYARASSIGSLVEYGPFVFSPALVGILYPITGLVGILTIDTMTFAVAIASLLFVNIPQPSQSDDNSHNQTIWQQVIFGLNYILTKPGLSGLLVATSLFWFMYQLGTAIYEPMILARTGGNSAVFSNVTSAAGVGGVFGAVAIGIWGGPQRRIKGIVIGLVGVSLSRTVFGLGQIPLIWVIAQFCSSLSFPLLGSSETALWLTKVAPNLQGRVFATRRVFGLTTSALAYLIAGPLADYIFEPAFAPGGKLAAIFGGFFGTGKGAGMALLYEINALCLLLLGYAVYTLPMLRNVEDIVPDHDASIK